MHALRFLAIASLTAAPAGAQDDWHPVSPDNTWSITDSNCMINAGWDGDAQIVITPHDDHHDFGLYDNHIRGLSPERVIALRFGTDGDVNSAREYHALGHKDGAGLSYISDVDTGLLDWLAGAGSLQVYRGKLLLEDLDMTGFAEALSAQRACETANGLDAPADAVTALEDAVEAEAEAAAAAAAAQAEADAVSEAM